MKLNRVKWFSGNLKEFDRFHAMVGLWISPDTIILDYSTVEDSLTVEHELLHYLLQAGPNDEKHPVLYFVTKCHLIEPLGPVKPRGGLETNGKASGH